MESKKYIRKIPDSIQLGISDLSHNLVGHGAGVVFHIENADKTTMPKFKPGSTT